MKVLFALFLSFALAVPVSAMQDEVPEDTAETEIPADSEEGKLEELRQLMAGKSHEEVVARATELIDSEELTGNNLAYARYLRGVALVILGERESGIQDLDVAREIPAFRSWSALYSLDYHADQEDWEAVAKDIIDTLAPPGQAADNIRNRTVFWTVRELKKAKKRDTLKAFLVELWNMDFRGESRGESVERLWYEYARLLSEDGDLFSAGRAIKRVSSFELALAAVQDRKLEALMGRSDVAHWFAPERVARRSLQAARARANAARQDFYAHAALINELRTFGHMEEAAAVVADVESRIDEMDSRNNGDLWFMNVAAMLAAYEGDQPRAEAWFEKALEADIDERPASVSQLLNYGMFLWNRGRDEKAREIADRLLGEADGKLSDFGRYVALAMDQCIAAHTGKPATVADGLAKMANLKVLDTRVYTLTLMCHGRDEEAASHIIERLADPEQAMQAAQLYVKSRGMHERAGRERAYHDRIKAMIERADVRAAFEAVARPFELDAWVTWWGVY